MQEPQPLLKQLIPSLFIFILFLVFESISKAGKGWAVYRELTLYGLMGLPVPEGAMAVWYRMCACAFAIP
jgi:hypothetical protein